jgi:hypothetical protein
MYCHVDWHSTSFASACLIDGLIDHDETDFFGCPCQSLVSIALQKMQIWSILSQAAGEEYLEKFMHS